MSNQTNFTSLIQLITYTGFKDFLTQYHKEIKDKTGQFVGINKALACATKVIKGYKNHHQFTHSLEKVENNQKLFGIRKNVIIITTVENIGEGDLDFTTETFSSWDEARDSLRSDFYSLAMREDLDVNYLNELFESYYNEDDFDNSLDFVNHIEENDSIDIYDFASAIEDVTNKEKQVSIKDSFVDLNVTTGDIHEAIHKNDFETGLTSE